MSRRHPVTKRLSQCCSPVLEALERRTLLTGVTFNWLGGPGNWNDPSHWSHSPPPSPETDRSLPSGEDTVGIGAGAGTVTIPAGIPVACKTLNLTANLRMENGSNLYLVGGNLNINDTASDFSEPLTSTKAS